MLPGAAGAEVIDDVENDPNPEDPEAGLDPAGDAGADPGATDPNFREGAEGDSGADGEAEPGGDVADPRDETISELKARLEKLEKPAAPAPTPAPAYKEPTEEEWQKHEEATGLSRTAIKFTAQQMANLHNRFEQMLNARFGKFEKDNAISSLSKQKGFEDFAKYRKGVDEFLSKYDESVHSNQELLQNAYYYAKGKGSPEAVRRAANQTERNKRIAVNGRPASPNSSGRRVSVQLTGQQRMLAKKAGMSDGEYFNLLPKRKK